MTNLIIPLSYLVCIASAYMGYRAMKSIYDAYRSGRTPSRYPYIISALCLGVTTLALVIAYISPVITA